MNEISFYSQKAANAPSNVMQKVRSRKSLEQIFSSSSHIPNQDSQKSLKHKHNNTVCYSAIEEDLEDDDISDTLTLRSNLNASILTEAKSSFFNKKIHQFNYDKNKFSLNPTTAVSLSQKFMTVQDPYQATYRCTTVIDSALQGPKNYFATELNSPKPKDNSLDEINDMLFEDFSDDDELNRLINSPNIPVKDYLEISQAFERNDQANSERETVQNDEQLLFSRGDDENCDYLDLLDSEDLNSTEFLVL